MPTNPQKTIGNHGDCFKCGKPMFCNEVEYGGTKKAQWQNKDGKAHYTKDGNCKGELTPNMPQPSQVSKIEKGSIDLDSELLDRTITVSRQACQFLKAIELAAYEELGASAAPAHIGLYVKIISDKMLGLPNLQEILEGVGGKK